MREMVPRQQKRLHQKPLSCHLVDNFTSTALYCITTVNIQQQLYVYFLYSYVFNTYIFAVPVLFVKSVY